MAGMIYSKDISYILQSHLIQSPGPVQDPPPPMPDAAPALGLCHKRCFLQSVQGRHHMQHRSQSRHCSPGLGRPGTGSSMWGCGGRLHGFLTCKRFGASSS